jgi:5'-methylthioadenosine phosphorylase
MSIAIIGGTGVELAAPDAHDEVIPTRWGKALVTRTEANGRELLFLHRHADPDSGRRHVPPHKINYRANIAALKKLGASVIFASTAVGSLREEWQSGTLVLLDQFLDFTSNRAKTFFDERAVHVDMTQPYCPRARAVLLCAARELNCDLQDGGTYLCADGPRFETPAEIRAFKSWGADVVGMTGAPEVALAREAEISYAGISIVTNAAAGISPHPLTQAEVLDAMKIVLPRVVELFLRAAQNDALAGSTPNGNALDEFVSAEWNPRAIFDGEK